MINAFLVITASRLMDVKLANHARHLDIFATKKLENVCVHQTLQAQLAMTVPLVRGDMTF